MSRNEPPMDPELGLDIDTGSKAKNQYVVLSRFQKLMKSRNTAMVLTAGLLLGAVTVGGTFYFYGAYEEDSRKLAILGEECGYNADTSITKNCGDIFRELAIDEADYLYCVQTPPGYLGGLNNICLHLCSEFDSESDDNNKGTLQLQTLNKNLNTANPTRAQLQDLQCACGKKKNADFSFCTQDECENDICKLNTRESDWCVTCGTATNTRGKVIGV